jgi:dolichol-phosphate mannosyltransferase
MRLPLEQVLVTAVLPVYNEANVLEELSTRVASAIKSTGAKYEIVFVNDGSTDASPQILDRLATENPNIRVLHFSRNFGHQAAVQAGLAYASGDAVILMDSDLQDSPEAIGRLLAEWRAGYDVVYAIRSSREEPLWKRCLFDGFHNLLSRISSTPVPAHAGNFSLIDRRVVRDIVALQERDRYLPGLRAWVGYRQKGLEVRRGARYDNQPRVSLRGLWRLAKSAIFSFSSLPLAVFYVIGYLSLGAFALLSGFALFCKLFTTWAIPGWTSEMLVASFFGAVNALGISILGEYVTRIYDQVRGRPLYLIARSRNDSNAITSEEMQCESVLTEARALVDLRKAFNADESTVDAWNGTDRREIEPSRKERGSNKKLEKRHRKSRGAKAK